jgi:predicted metalloprotease with PDZ domain
MGGGGASVLIQMQPGSDLGDPRVDWQAAHEMVHLAVPEMSRAQIWLSEGLATYIEPFARLSTGELSAEKIWGDLVAGLPQGLPRPGDQGLDRTHTWGRTYWGGALFAFVADVEIRRATAGRRSLATAMRGALDAGGDTRVGWTVDRFLSTCDDEVGQPVLTTLYRQLRDRPGHVDLDSMWRALGVAATPEGIRFDDRAPLAQIRRQMSSPRDATASPR